MVLHHRITLVLLLLCWGPAPFRAAPDAGSPQLPPQIRQLLDIAGQGRKHAALVLADRWLADHPGDVGGHVLRGDLRLDCLEACGAARDFRFALSANPHDRYALARLFETLQFSLQYEEAARLLEEAALPADGEERIRRALTSIRDRSRHLVLLRRRRRMFITGCLLVTLAWMGVLFYLYSRIGKLHRPR